MRQWEYQTWMINDWKVWKVNGVDAPDSLAGLWTEEALNKARADGWELLQVRDEDGYVKYYLKRLGSE